MHTDINILRNVQIKEIIQETQSVKTLIFDDHLSANAKPGQFLMVWIPRKEEIPLSIMISNYKNSAGITVRRYGYASTSLYNLKKGDFIGLRGPYGNSFTVNKKNRRVIMIGGGTGMVPLVRLIYYLKEIEAECLVIVGAKTKSELFFINLINQLLKTKRYSLVISTEDGSAGLAGYPTDYLAQILSEDVNFDIVYTCGPELMMKKVFDLTLKTKVELEASIERYMKCGIGICSSCCINDRLVCVDGTIFNKNQLNKLSDFGTYYRNKSGILEHF